MRNVFAILIVSLFLPALAFADGSQNYATPGIYTFSVPAYGSLEVQVWGGGAGGNADTQSGGRGGQSSFNGTLIGGGGGSAPISCSGIGNPGGAGGSASGGDTNTIGSRGGAANQNTGGSGGNSPNGGTGGAGVNPDVSGYVNVSGSPGGAPGAGGGSAPGVPGCAASGGGGAGGYVVKTYSAGSLISGTTLTVVVGAGGTGANPGNRMGGSGASGSVSITWTSGASSNPCSTNPLLCVQICSDGSQAVNGICPASTTSPTDSGSGTGSGSGSGSGACAAGYISISGACVLSCIAGSAYQGSVCVAQCDPGYNAQGGVCVFSSCPIGYTQQGSHCMLTSCGAGYTLENGQCVAEASCVSQNYCSGNNLYHQSLVSNSCVQSLIQICTYGCSNGACVPPPSPQIVTWNVHPTLVPSGTAVTVQWNASNVKSCIVSGTNGDWWSGLSGTYLTTPIVKQTIYTITCIALPEATPTSVTESTTVNVIPNFKEF